MKIVIPVLLMFAGLMACNSGEKREKRIPVAKAGNVILYDDEIPDQVKNSLSSADSIAYVQNYINKWAKRELIFQKAEENLSPEMKIEIENHLEQTKIDLVVYEYQQMLMLQKMDTVISREELEKYYSENQNNFILSSNIVKAVFIRLPVETPELWKIKMLARSNKQSDFQELESRCYQFAERFDDFNEEWITLDKLAIDLNEDIGDQEVFLKRNSYYETTDSASVSLVTINDYRLRGSIAPYEYVKDDIKRIIWNNRRIDFIQSLEQGIYNDALRNNDFKVY